MSEDAPGDEARPQAAEPLAVAASEARDRDEPMEGLEGFEIVIGPDGSVTFLDLPPEMLDVASALDPDDPLVCERAALVASGGAASSGGRSE